MNRSHIASKLSSEARNWRKDKRKDRSDGATRMKT